MTRRRPARPAARARVEPPSPVLPLGEHLRRRFPAGLPTPPPPPPAPPPPPTPMTEGEIMAAVFTALERGDAIDLAAIRVVARPLAAAPAAGRAAAPPTAPPTSPPLEPGLPGQDLGDMSLRSDPRPGRPPVDASPDLAGLRDRLRAGPAWTAPAPPPLDRADLTPAQRSLLADAARHAPLPLLRLRGLARGDALDALHDFVTLHRAAGRRYVRVIPGKGLGSRAEPVLKASVLAWCAGEGLAEVDAFAPEPDDPEGTYGALILRLRLTRRGP